MCFEPVEAMGLEPTTSTLQRSHSSQLSYAPVDDGMCSTSVITLPVDPADRARSGPTRHPGTTVTPTSYRPCVTRRTTPAPSLLDGAPLTGRPDRRAAPRTKERLHGHHRPRPTARAPWPRGCEALTSSDRWRSHLELQGRFHRYSFNNALLIGDPGPGGHPGRRIRHVEEARADRCARGNGPSGSWPRWSGGAVRTRDGVERRPIIGFRAVPVFDVAQTEGEELPEVCRNLEGDDPAACFDALAGRAAGLGYSVEPTELPGTTNGDCAYALRRIRVEVPNRPAQRVKTLAHELAHALLHEGCRRPGPGRARGGVHRLRGVPDPRPRLGRVLVRLRGLLGRGRTGGGRRHRLVGCRHPTGRAPPCSTDSTRVRRPGRGRPSSRHALSSVRRPARSTGRSPPTPPRRRRTRRPRSACAARGPCRPRRSGRSRT